MLNRVTVHNPPAFRGNNVAMQGSPDVAIEVVPVARQIADKKTRATGGLVTLVAGGIAAPLAGMGLDKLSGAEGPIVRLARTVSAKTGRIDTFLSNLKIQQRLAKIVDPVINRLFSKTNLETFSKGYHSGGGIIGALRASRKAAKAIGDTSRVASIDRSFRTLGQIKNLGPVGKFIGKSSIFLKKNLTGSVGVINGLFAAITVNSVVKAKKGEKFSTFMEDFLGTWIGSIGGFRITENILKGFNAFRSPQTAKIAGKGVIPFVAKVVDKVPLKGFIVPMIGAMVFSSLLQKVSHLLFGKPTREEPIVISNMDDFNKWLDKTGWTHYEKAVVRAQVQEKLDNQEEVAIVNK